MNELDLMEKIEFVEPCARVAAQFDAHGSDRWLCLANLTAEKLHCVWCDGPLAGKQRRWCSIDCVKAAQFRAAPQQAQSKVWRLIHLQDWACKGCGLSFEEQLRKDILAIHKRHNRIKPATESEWTVGRYEHEPEKKVTYWQLGDGTGFLFQTDHIIPIFKGGKGIDPANLQVLCVACHQAKTINERKVTNDDNNSRLPVC